jgi:hypothetical protein
VKLSAVFKLEKPEVMIPWLISVEDLISLLLGKPKKVTPVYYTIRAVSLRGLSHVLGIHFNETGRLYMLEFFRKRPHLNKSFPEFQEHLVAVFGPPLRTWGSEKSFPAHRWIIEGIGIYHYVIDRFGPEEHLEMRMGPSPPEYFRVVTRS